MKTALSIAIGSVLLLPVLVAAAPPAPTQSPAQAPGKAVQAPTQAPTQAPAKAPAQTAQANTGYRTYSYMPAATAPANYGYTGYYGRPTRRPAFFSGLQPADYKVRGEFWAR